MNGLSQNKIKISYAGKKMAINKLVHMETSDIKNLWQAKSLVG